MRLLGILFAVLIFSAGSLFTVRFWGLGMQYQAYEHPYTNQLPEFAVRVESLEQLQQLVQQKTNSIVWLDIRPSKDAKLLILPETSPEKMLTPEAVGLQDFRGNKPAVYDLVFLRKFFAQAPLLEDIVNRAPSDTKFIFNVIDSVLDIDKNMIAFIEQHQLEKRVMIQSPAAVVVTAIKAERPTWIFGTNQTDWVKLLSFQSAYVLPAAPFKADVLSMPLIFNKRPMLNTELIAEMRRRYKKVFAGPLTDLEQVKIARALNPDLCILTSPDLLREVLAELKSK